MKDASSDPVSRRRPPDGRLIVGRLEGHGHANYRFQADQSPSYYLKLLTDRGRRLLWGTDLARALAQSVTQPKIGSMVGVRSTGYETVTLSARSKDTAHPDTAPREVRRNRWVVETLQFFADRARLARRVRDDQVQARDAVRNHPELLSTYLTVRGAEEIARLRISDPKDREGFVALVKEAMATSIADGAPLPTVRMKGTLSLKTAPNPPAKSPKPDEPTR